MKQTLCFLLFFCLFFTLTAQPKSYLTQKSNMPIKIDGNMSEAVWAEAAIADSFIQNTPNTGKPSAFKSEVKVLYDNIGIYIGAVLYDNHPDSILKELGVRDAGENNADLFQVMLDTYNDKQNAFAFMVSAAGTQSDARWFNTGTDGNRDNGWNAAWNSAVKIKENGWVVEIAIPYSAIRFADKPEQIWGINFMRVVRRTREKSYWNETNPAVQGVVNQFGLLEGIRDVKPPLRLMLFPYISTYLMHQSDNNQLSPLVRGGADVKYGINESFTLDMTLVPDFGQVQSDNIVYNLSPFEVRFNEYRQFFTEGTELFNKLDLFYSRRVGGTPQGVNKPYQALQADEEVVMNPLSAQLLNATKVSGRTGKNLGIGVFNALTAKTMAVIRNEQGEERKVETSPLTNYNMLVFDQPFLKNSFVSLLNTNVSRLGEGYSNANVTALMAKIADKQNKWGITGNGRLSSLYGANLATQNGYAYELLGGKYNGKFTFELGRKVFSNTYQQNDLGYLANNNNIQNSASFSSNRFEPKGKLIRRRNTFNLRLSQYYANKGYSSFVTAFNGFYLTQNFFAFGYEGEFYPIFIRDYFATRLPNRYIELPGGGWLNGWISTDYRKKFALDLNGGYFKAFQIENYSYWFNVSPRFRLNNHLSIFYTLDSDNPRKEIGWAALDSSGETVFGKRRVNTITNTLTTTYTFTPRMSLSFRLRHYSLSTRYEEYYHLDEKGKWYLWENYPQNHDLSFNAFNIDCVYQWEFRTGSFLNVVWKNSISDFQPAYLPSFYHNVRQTFEAPQLNSLSVRVVYLLDAQMFKRKV